MTVSALEKHVRNCPLTLQRCCRRELGRDLHRLWRNGYRAQTALQRGNKTPQDLDLQLERNRRTAGMLESTSKERLGRTSQNGNKRTTWQHLDYLK